MAGQQEVDVRSAEAPQPSPSSGGLWKAAWDGFKHTSGISAVEAVVHSEPVQNMLNDFRLIDDGTHSFNEAARKHITHGLNGTQMHQLEDERDEYKRGLVISALPVGVGDGPQKGQQMKQFDEQVDKVVKEAEKQAERSFNGDEMKQLLDERKRYEWAHIALAGGHSFTSPEKGPMIKEYEKRVLHQIDSTSISWKDKQQK